MLEIKPKQDNVNHPSHYETGKFECIDAMLEALGIDNVKGFCLCNAFKYLYRCGRKNGMEDIKKAKWYIDKLIELKETETDFDDLAKWVFNGTPLPKSNDAERIKGQWITDTEESFFGNKCSVCGKVVIGIFYKTSFCPNCGADMRCTNYHRSR